VARQNFERVCNALAAGGGGVDVTGSTNSGSIAQIISTTLQVSDLEEELDPIDYPNCSWTSAQFDAKEQACADRLSSIVVQDLPNHGRGR